MRLPSEQGGLKHGTERKIQRPKKATREAPHRTRGIETRFDRSKWIRLEKLVRLPTEEGINLTETSWQAVEEPTGSKGARKRVESEIAPFRQKWGDFFIAVHQNRAVFSDLGEAGQLPDRLRPRVGLATYRPT